MFERFVFSKVRDTVCYHLNHYWPEDKVTLCDVHENVNSSFALFKDLYILFKLCEV